MKILNRQEYYAALEDEGDCPRCGKKTNLVLLDDGGEDETRWEEYGCKECKKFFRIVYEIAAVELLDDEGE